MLPALSPEDVRDQLETIRSVDGYAIPASTPEESALFAPEALSAMAE